MRLFGLASRDIRSGGFKFWKAMSDIDLYGDDVLNAVNGRLDEMDVPNNNFVNSLHWLQPDNKASS